MKMNCGECSGTGTDYDFKDGKTICGHCEGKKKLDGLVLKFDEKSFRHLSWIFDRLSEMACNDDRPDKGLASLMEYMKDKKHRNQVYLIWRIIRRKRWNR